MLDRLIARETELDPKDFKLIMDSVMGIHRVRQLEAGEPTDIKKVDAMSPEELKKFMRDAYEDVMSKHGAILDSQDLPAVKPEAKEVH